MITINLPDLPPSENGERVGPERLVAYEASLNALETVQRAREAYGANGVAAAYAVAQLRRAMESGPPIGTLPDGTVLYACPRRGNRSPRAVLEGDRRWRLVDVIASTRDGYPVSLDLQDDLPPGWRTWAETEEGAPGDVAYPA